MLKKVGQIIFQYDKIIFMRYWLFYERGWIKICIIVINSITYMVMREN